MKYIIDLEKIDGTDLYKAKGFNTLVFDNYGIGLLEPYDMVNAKPLSDGDIIRTPNGTAEYEFKGYSENGHINAIKLKDKMFCTLPANKYVVVKRALQNS